MNKIAIQGHSTRGKEVIQILESLGGTNDYLFKGVGNFWYFIDSNGHITNEYQTVLIHTGFKTYTLEEFEKEFPFKIGDIVQTKPCGEPAEVIDLYPNPACIIAYKVRYKSGKEMQHCPENIKFYEEMNEERNITLTLDKAKEWYKKGGELKEIALQAFKESELNPLPRSWEEFCEKYRIEKEESYINSEGKILSFTTTSKRSWNHICPSQKSAEAHLAMIQLEHLRNCWRQGNIPQKGKYKIRKVGNKYTIVYGMEDAFLSFCDLQTTEEFLECFRDLIEKAGDLI